MCACTGWASGERATPLPAGCAASRESRRVRATPPADTCRSFAHVRRSAGARTRHVAAAGAARARCASRVPRLSSSRRTYAASCSCVRVIAAIAGPMSAKSGMSFASSDSLAPPAPAAGTGVESGDEGRSTGDACRLVLKEALENLKNINSIY